MRSYCLIFGLAIALISCKKNTPTSQSDKELEELFVLMQGSFNSQQQSESDSTYYNISLHMYPIWQEKGYFLYVEQALNNRQTRPYRQRIYELTRMNDSMFRSAIYTLPLDSLWIGKWKNAQAFDSLSVNDLNLRKGCEVMLKRIEKSHYVGKTGLKSCESALRGAAYATSEVVLLKEKIISWDRGFDSIGNHVWGATKGGYIFDKIITNQ